MKKKNGLVISQTLVVLCGFIAVNAMALEVIPMLATAAATNPSPSAVEQAAATQIKQDYANLTSLSNSVTSLNATNSILTSTNNFLLATNISLYVTATNDAAQITSLQAQVASSTNAANFTNSAGYIALTNQVAQLESVTNQQGIALTQSAQQLTGAEQSATNYYTQNTNYANSLSIINSNAVYLNGVLQPPNQITTNASATNGP